jgi:hypothetical protein
MLPWRIRKAMDDVIHTEAESCGLRPEEQRKALLQKFAKYMQKLVRQKGQVISRDHFLIFLLTNQRKEVGCSCVLEVKYKRQSTRMAEDARTMLIPKKLPKTIPVFLNYMEEIQGKSYKRTISMFKQFWEKFSAMGKERTKRKRKDDADGSGAPGKKKEKRVEFADGGRDGENDDGEANDKSRYDAQDNLERSEFVNEAKQAASERYLNKLRNLFSKLKQQGSVRPADIEEGEITLGEFERFIVEKFEQLDPLFDANAQNPNGGLGEFVDEQQESKLHQRTGSYPAGKGGKAGRKNSTQAYLNSDAGEEDVDESMAEHSSDVDV